MNRAYFFNSSYTRVYANFYLNNGLGIVKTLLQKNQFDYTKA